MPNPSIRSILVPTDFSDASVVAFSHALRLSLALRADLDVFHVEPKNDTADWHWAPGVMETLIRWGDLPAGATADDLATLGVRARRTMVSGISPDQAIFQEMASSHADLVVLSTHGRSGMRRWLQPSVATPVALKGATLVLLLPAGVEGFVRRNTGLGGIRKVLVPVDSVPHPAPAFDAARLLVSALPGEQVELATLHVGPGAAETDLLRVPPGWALHHWRDEGAPVERILDRVTSWEPDLLVMVTEGRTNWLDGLRGSTVERVLAAEPKCPVLIVPAEWTGEV